MLRLASVLVFIGVTAFPAQAAAQTVPATLDGIPADRYPPPNMCRVWLDRVQPSRQPRPVDCATATRTAPRNSRIIYGVSAIRPGAVLGSGTSYPRDRRRPHVGTVDRRQPECVWREGDRRQPDCDLPPGNRQRPSNVVSVACSDGDRDGFCDQMMMPVRRPDRLPAMVGAIWMGRGVRTTDVKQWLNNEAVFVRYGTADGGRTPERAFWFNRAGQVVQQWVDTDRDGRANQVAIYQNGRLVRVIED